MAEILIEGILCSYRDLKTSTVTEDGELIEGEEILYAELPKDEQYFKIVSHPFTDDELVGIANKEYTYSPLQRAWVDKQNYIFDNGCYAYIEGELTFIPGAYWCYINFWTLENGEKPEYREDDRIFFLFHEHLRLNTDCLATTRLKGRRQGATSAGMFFKWFIAGRNEFKNCGSTSFTDTAAADNFQRMFMYGFKAMLPCFQSEFDSDSENFIRFVKPVEKKRKGILAIKREGLNSYVDYKSNAINSYDSGRQSYNVPDESAKRGTKVDINSYWSRLSKTLVIGINKVGFAYLPTTVGMPKEGGENYEIFFNNSNQYAIDAATKEPYGINTPTRCVYFFMPATKCYAGCISKFGKSIIEDPAEPVMGNNGQWITEGSKTKILRERNRLTGNQLMEHRREYPLDLFDAFAFTIGVCEFNEENIQTQIRYIKDNPAECYWRKARLVLKKEIIKSIYPHVKDKEKRTVDWMEDEKGMWQILEEPNKPNHFEYYGSGDISPLNTNMYVIGIDPTKDIQTVNGSWNAVVVFKKSCIITVDGEKVETGLYPVAILHEPTRMHVHFDDEVLKAAMWYGCKAAYEIDARWDYTRHFRSNKAGDFLEWTPKIMMSPLKPKKLPEPGLRSGDQFQLTQMLQICKWYIDGNSMNEYNGYVQKVKYIPLLEQLLKYDHADRTKSDLVVALQMALCSVFGEIQSPTIPTNIKQLLPTWKIEKYG